MAKRPVKYMSMAAYRKFMEKSPEQRKLVQVEERNELDLTEVRMQALAKVREVFGPGEKGWRACQDKGGCHWSTYRDWSDRELHVQPQARSLFKTALACGIKPDLFG